MTHHKALCYILSGGKKIKATDFAFTLDGFQQYLNAYRIKHFPAQEITKIHHQGLLEDSTSITTLLKTWGRPNLAHPDFIKSLAQEVSDLPKHKGVSIALPRQSKWVCLMACILMADSVRHKIDKPVAWVNGCRPKYLNEAVGGAKHS